MTESDVRHLEQCVIEAFWRVLKKRKVVIPYLDEIVSEKYDPLFRTILRFADANGFNFVFTSDDETFRVIPTSESVVRLMLRMVSVVARKNPRRLLAVCRELGVTKNMLHAFSSSKCNLPHFSTVVALACLAGFAIKITHHDWCKDQFQTFME